MASNNSIRNVFLLFIIFGVGCKPNTRKVDENSSLFLENCYIVKPVKNDSKADTLRFFEFSGESVEKVLLRIISRPELIKYDSSMEYVTSFETQKIFQIGDACYSKMKHPDSLNLMGIYLTAGYQTRTFTKPIVQFVDTIKKKVKNLGELTVFKYSINSVSEIEPHFMYIFLQDRSLEDAKLKKDYKGYLLLSDGIEWSNLQGDSSIPILIKNVRRSKELCIPLIFDGDRFIPIGHFKGNIWE